MSSAEIKALRQEGKLEEALNMAIAALEQEPSNIWNKRNLSWVQYEYLKKATSENNPSDFLHWLSEVKSLELPGDEKILYDQVAWQIGLLLFKIVGAPNFDVNLVKDFLGAVKDLPISKKSEAYTFLFKAFHKGLKDNPEYINFFEWWGLDSFREEDYHTEKIKDGKDLMAIAEQAYIAYSKHILNQKNSEGQTVLDREKALVLIDRLSTIIEQYPKLLYLPYYKAKLLLATGDENNVLSALLPFARKKQNDFWVWDILSDALHNEPEKSFACLCKALSCKSPSEMLVGVRQKMAGILIAKKLYNEAKTEISLLLKAREKEGYRTPAIISTWVSQPWYKNASAKDSNNELYRNYLPEAESILYGDFPETNVIVEFVNTDKKILNFITADLLIGFFKYDRFINNISIGDILSVRFQLISTEGPSKILSVRKHSDNEFRSKFIKELEGSVLIKEDSTYGFINDTFINPNLVTKFHLSNGTRIKAEALKSYNQKKKSWEWKIYKVVKTID